MSKRHETTQHTLPSGQVVTLRKIGPVGYGRVQAFQEEPTQMSFHLVLEGVQAPKYVILENGEDLKDGCTDLDDLDLTDFFNLLTAVQDYSGFKEAMESISPLSETDSAT